MFQNTQKLYGDGPLETKEWRDARLLDPTTTLERETEQLFQIDTRSIVPWDYARLKKTLAALAI